MRNGDKEGLVSKTFPRSVSPTDNLILDFGLSELRMIFCCFKPSSLWYFVKIALNKQTNKQKIALGN